jgi:hypothetical protein
MACPGLNGIALPSVLKEITKASHFFPEVLLIRNLM